MSLGDFMNTYGGRRLDGYAPQPPLYEAATESEEGPDDLDGLDYEVSRDEWEPLDPALGDSWRAEQWDERPIRFIDGKDVGETVAWLRSPAGYPVPIRLSQIGGVVVRLVNGECRRDFVVVDRVVSMVADVFPWDEVESFAAELQACGLRLLCAQPPGMQPSFDFEQMRKAAQDRSKDEMGVLEEAALAQAPGTPTVVDGPLEPRTGGFSPTDPVVGVIKKHQRNYLHGLGMGVLYELEPGQRSPVFRLGTKRYPVVSWYVRLSGGATIMPNWGLIRVEVPMPWFETRGQDWTFVDQLSRTLFDYRCREASYSRMPVSLHPIVRAEESLGSLFSPHGRLSSSFYRLTEL